MVSGMASMESSDKKGSWRLAPAYDITYAFNPDGMWTGSHQMRINGKQKDIMLEDLLSAGKNMDLRKSEAEEAIDAVRNSLDKWHMFADQAESGPPLQVVV